MLTPSRISRRALVGVPAAFSVACQIREVFAPRPLDFSWGPDPYQHLDVYNSAPARAHPAPLLMLFGGGGWHNPPKLDAVGFVPMLTSRGYVVVNTGYRVASEAKAPAAAEDVRNAIEAARLRAPRWGASTRRMLVMGFSAGAHLALLSALASPSDLGGPQSHPFAIVSFWGVTDFVEILSGERANAFAQRWLPEGPERLSLASRLSPIDYDVSAAPPLCAVHSVQDDVVAFSHSERMVEKYRKAGRPATLIKLTHKGHAAPHQNDYPGIFDEVFRFLDGLGVPA